MNLYLLTQTTLRMVNSTGFYDSAVVAAENDMQATFIHPAPDVRWNIFAGEWQYEANGVRSLWKHKDWPDMPSKITARLIGTAAPGVEAGVVCASYNPE